MKKFLSRLALLLGTWAVVGLPGTALAQFTVNDGTARGTCSQASFQNGSLVLSPAGCLGSTAPPPNDPVFTVRFATAAGTQPVAGSGPSAPVFVYVDSDRDLPVGATYNMVFNLCLSTQGCNPSSGAFYFFRYGGLGGTGFTEADKRATLNQPFTFLPGEGTSPTNLRSMLVGGLHLSDLPAFSGTAPVTASLGGANASAAVATFTITGSVAGSTATYAWVTPKAKQRTENATPNWGNGQLMEDFTIQRSNANGVASQVIVEICRNSVFCQATPGVNYQTTDTDLQNYFASAGITTLVANKKFAVNFGAAETSKQFFVQVLNSTEVSSPTLTLELENGAGTVLDVASVQIVDKGGGSTSGDIDINGVPIPSPTGPAGATMCDLNPQTFQTGPYPGSGPGPCGSYQIPVGNCSSGMSGANAINRAYEYILEDVQPGSPRLGNSMRMAIPRDAAMIFKFKTGPSGAFPEFLLPPFYRNLTIGYDEQVSRGPAAPHFVTISETRCDFDYTKTLTNGTLNGCYMTMSSSGSVLSKIWPAGSEPAPAADFPYCPLKPDTNYYMNIRYEDASNLNSRGILNCPGGACGAAIGFN